MWSSEVDGRVLNFQLAGINNRNFIMRDEETGTWWQQANGEAILGPLKGKTLGLIPQDEISYGVWKREQPRGRVLKPDPKMAANFPSSEQWEKYESRFSTIDPGNTADSFPRLTEVFGITSGGAAKAYLLASLQKQSPIVDQLENTPVMVVLGDDKTSVRAFDRTVDGRPLEFFSKPGTGPLTLVDSETGSEWDFSGRAVSGQLAGKRLKQINALRDFWFDWTTYHPSTQVY